MQASPVLQECHGSTPHIPHGFQTLHQNYSFSSTKELFDGQGPCSALPFFAGLHGDTGIPSFFSGLHVRIASLIIRHCSPIRLFGSVPSVSPKDCLLPRPASFTTSARASL